jgi:hypothetical protein
MSKEVKKMNQPQAVTLKGGIGPLATLKDGRLFSCYSEPDSYKNLEDERPERWAYIRTSNDSGHTWTEPKKAFAFPAGKGTASVGLPLVDHESNIHIFSLRCYRIDLGSKVRVRNDQLHSVVLHNVSNDAGKTWSELKEIDFGHGYNGGFNCAIQMDNGRILFPLGYYDEQRTNGKFVSMVVYSDDGGQTWGKSNDCPVESGGEMIESGADEPVVVQFRSGLVWMLIRTQTGYLWESFSDNGAIWTPPISTRIVSSNSPAGVLRLRDGRLVLFWNNLYGEPFDLGASYRRHTLHAAISDDEGQTWSPPKVIAQRRPEDSSDSQTTYPFPCQASDGAVLVFYARTYRCPGGEWHDACELVRVDPDWLASP